MLYNFDEIIDRKHTNSINTDGFRDFIFHAGPDMKFPYADDEFIRMWIADMEFACAEPIRQAIIDRVNRKIFGYTIMSLDTDYHKSLNKWCEKNTDGLCHAKNFASRQGLFRLCINLWKSCASRTKRLLW